MRKKLFIACGLALGMNSALAAQPAFLHESVSPDMYLRLPQPWTLLLADGKRDEAALQPHWAQVRDKIAHLPESIGGLSGEDKILLADLLKHTDSGLEAALYFGKNGVLTVAGASHYTFRDADAFLAHIRGMLESDAGWTHDGDGKAGRITDAQGSLRIAYRFDASNGRLLWLASPDLPENPDWTLFTGDGDASLRATAAQLDPSGEGFLLWSRGNPLLLIGAGGEAGRPWIKALQLLKLKSLALGYGADESSRPRLQFNAEITAGGLRDFFPFAAPAGDVAVHGKLQSLYAFTLPDQNGMRNILRVIEQGSGERNLYLQAQTALKEAFDIELGVLLDALGAQWTVIRDDFGAVFAMPRTAQWDDAIAMLGRAGIVTLDDADAHGIRHARISLVPLFRQDPAMAREMEENGIVKMLLSMPKHVYWQDEGDYRVFAALPQPLMDRARSKAGKSLASYLGAGGIDKGEHNAFILANVDHLAREHYYSRLRWLQYLADMAGVNIPMASLPSPQMLDLPQSGYLSAALGGDAQNLRLSLRFEHSLLDAMHSSGYSTASALAGFGILSAIALPAYQDYVARANAAKMDSMWEAPELTQAEIDAIRSVIDGIYRASAPLREKIDRGDSVSEADIAALQAAVPGLVEYNEDYGLYFTFNGDAPAYLQESTLILWLGEGEDKDKREWYCYLEDPYLQGDTLLPPSCTPYNQE